MALLMTAALSFAFLLALYLPYVYSIPDHYGKTLTTDNNSKMMLVYAIGESALIFFVGYLMEWIHPMMFFGYMLLAGCLMVVFHFKTISSFKAVQKDELNEENVASSTASIKKDGS